MNLDETRRPARLTHMILKLAIFLLPGAHVSAQQAHPIAPALEQALDAGWQELHLEVGCLTESGFRSVQILGNGVGIWNKEKQFRLTEDEIKAQLKVFKEVDFAAMENSYGGKNDSNDPKNLPPKLTCSVSLRLDGITKESRQLYEGRQFEELRHLAERILDHSRTLAESGITADGLNDGLAKIANAELAPETLRVMVHRRISPESSTQAEAGWLLRIDGLIISTQLHTPTEGYSTPLILDLEQEEIATLANMMREHGIADLPRNVYAEHYTDVTVGVLNHEKRIQARQFGRMTPTTHGEKQDRFDEFFRELQELHLRVAGQGKPDEN